MSYRLTPATERLILAAMGVAQGVPRVKHLLYVISVDGETHTAQLLKGETPELSELLDIDAALDTVAAHFSYFSPLEMSTEHLILGILYTHPETAAWFFKRNITPEVMDEYLKKKYGYNNTPLDMPADLDAYLSREANKKDSAENPSLYDVSITRILDAAANRALEALRVLEDYVRFGLDDAYLTEQFKQTRHSLHECLTVIPIQSRMGSRETLHDVGVHITAATEYIRTDPEDVLGANFSRLEESLRSLEEFSKVSRAEIAPRLEHLRYSVYTLHRAVLITRMSVQRLEKAQLYVLINAGADLDDEQFHNRVVSLISAGADVIQLRDKCVSDRFLLTRGRILHKCVHALDRKVLFIMNDRADLAVLSGADGIHVGQDELRVKEVRQVAGANMLVGVSVHTLEQAHHAVMDGANYLGVGPVFPSKTKNFTSFPGVALLKDVASQLKIPMFAIGGISLTNLDDVIAAGFTRVAVSSAVNDLTAARKMADRLHTLSGRYISEESHENNISGENNLENREDFSATSCGNKKTEIKPDGDGSFLSLEDGSHV